MRASLLNPAERKKRNVSEEEFMFTFATSPQIPKHAAAPRLLRNRLRATVCFCLAVFSFSAITFNDPQFAGRFFRRHLADVHRTNSMQGVHPVFAMPILVYGPAPIAAGACASASDSGAALNGRVTFDGIPKKFEAIDVSPEPNCAKFYTSSPMPEVSVTGSQNSLQNVIV
jgi:hypothetical protein